MRLTDLPEAETAHIRKAADRVALSHAILISGSGDRLAAARFAAAALECESEAGKPCGVCAACRKTAADIHPDVITVRDPEHKNLSVEVIREIRADAHIRPNEGRRKVYIFPDCAILPEAGQNILLKVVEEGPPYAAFLFCAENPRQLLQTIRSRCTEWKLHGETAESPAAAAAGEELCLAAASGKRGAAAESCVRLERSKISRDELALVLAWCREAYAAAALLPYTPAAKGYERAASALAKRLTKKQIMSTIELLQMYHGECSYNVGSGHVLGALAAGLEGISFD